MELMVQPVSNKNFKKQLPEEITNTEKINQDEGRLNAGRPGKRATAVILVRSDKSRVRVQQSKKRLHIVLL